jgi:hypothetical protein
MRNEDEIGKKTFFVNFVVPTYFKEKLLSFIFST